MLEDLPFSNRENVGTRSVRDGIESKFFRKAYFEDPKLTKLGFESFRKDRLEDPR